MKHSKSVFGAMSFLLFFCLTGCSTSETTTPTSPAVVQEEDCYLISDLVVQQENSQEFLLSWTYSTENQQYFYRIFQEDLTDTLWRNADGETVSPVLFTPGAEVTLVVSALPETPTYGYLGDRSYIQYTLQPENLLEIRLHEGDHREILSPFENLSDDQLIDIQYQTDQMDPPGFSSMSRAALGQTVTYLKELVATVQNQSGTANRPEATPLVLKLFYTDGSEVSLDFTGGENYQLAVTAGDQTVYYSLRYADYQPVMELVQRQKVS